MFSRTVEYALRAMVVLATEPESSHTAQEVGSRAQASAGYMSKILQSLGEAGLLRAQRGRHGGFVLERKPERVTIPDVINAVEPIRRIERCPLQIPGHTRLCPLHRRLDAAAAQVEEAFGSTTLAELVAESADGQSLCDG